MRKFWLGIAALVLTVSVSLAESDRKELIVFPGDIAAAHVVDGGGWSTSIVLVNLGSARQSGEILFFKDGGVPLAMDFKDIGTTASLDFTLRAKGTFVAETLGLSGTVSQGFAVMLPDNATTDEIGGSAIFRRSVPGQPVYEAVVPFSNILLKRHQLFFDHRDGYFTGMAVANLSLTSEVTVSLIFSDDSGGLIDYGELTLQPLGHTSFLLEQEASQLAGKYGSVDVTASSGADGPEGILVLGLRFNPTGPFTTLFPMVSLSDVADSLE